MIVMRGLHLARPMLFGVSSPMLLETLYELGIQAVFKRRKSSYV